MAGSKSRLFAISELDGSVSQLGNLISRYKTSHSNDLVNQIQTRVAEASEAFSGSWLGWHSRTYLNRLTPKQPGEHFDPIFGSKEYIGKTRGDWVEYAYDDVYNYVAGDELKELLKQSSENYLPDLKFQKNDLISILCTLEKDTYLDTIIEEAKALRFFTSTEIARKLGPSGSTTTQDLRAAGEGTQIPPHMTAHCELKGIQTTVSFGDALIQIATRASKHLKRLQQTESGAILNNTNTEATIFLGHGGSHLWKDLAMFITDTLQLRYQEYNSIATAGFARKERLEQLLDQCSFAFLIMTAEDQTDDGDFRARQNVIHEIGLFQGKLGFTKAIVMLEETCSDFSNIDGLDQIRFAKGNVLSESEQIRRVLQREGLLK